MNTDAGTEAESPVWSGLRRGGAALPGQHQAGHDPEERMGRRTGKRAQPAVAFWAVPAKLGQEVGPLRRKASRTQSHQPRGVEVFGCTVQSRMLNDAPRAS